MPKKKMDRLRFGTGGIPKSAEDTFSAPQRLKELGLDAMELEFVRSINISEDKAPKIKKAAEEHDIALSCHGQYFINLASKEEEKLRASMKRVVDAATRAHACGAWTMTFHGGFYQGRDAKEVTSMIHAAFEEIMDTLKDVDIWVRPEISGKLSQWGGMEEVIGISKKFDKVQPCIDFSHLYARTQGKINGYDGFSKALEQIEDGLGRQALQRMHIHAQGIEYGPKGEKRHLMLKDSDFDYKGLLKALKEFDVKGSVICEGPDMQSDALLLKKTYETVA
jgi:deoxyribonuclease-4